MLVIDPDDFAIRRRGANSSEKVQVRSQEHSVVPEGLVRRM